MRKALTMLGAIAALALGSMFAPSASAAVTCNPYVVGSRPTAWPAISATTSHFYNCLTNTASNNSKRDVVEGQLHDLPQKVKDYLQQRGVDFYLFKDDVDASAKGWSIDIGTAGVSIVFGNTPVTAIVTEVDFVLDTEVLSDKMLALTTAHEAAHHIDYTWRNTPTPGSDMLSGTKRFTDLYAHDRFLLNYKWQGAGTPTARNACGTSDAAFYQIRDPATNGFICSGSNGQGSSLNPGYSGTNAQIADQVFSDYIPRTQFLVEVAPTTMLPNQTYSITFTNADLPNGFVTISYTSVSGDTRTSIRNQLVSKITSNTSLSSKNITATASGNFTVAISAATTKLTYLSETATNGGEMYLQNAILKEFFAEKFATQVAAPQVPPYVTTDGDLTRQTAALDKFLQSAFGCTGTYMSMLRATSNTPPTPPNDPTNYSAYCVNALPAGYSFP